MLIESGYVEIKFQTYNSKVLFFNSQLTVNLFETFISTRWHDFFSRLWKADLFYLFILFIPPFIALHGSATIIVAVLMILMIMFAAVCTRVVGRHRQGCKYMFYAWCDPGTHNILWCFQTSTQQQHIRDRAAYIAPM